MTLAAGTRLGPYEILSALGAGGMGEVYRARDSKLKRDVALKILPDVFARDPDRMLRFQREAELLAALNHPHIAAIYGLEGNALVMELVEGENLRGPLPFETAVGYARQIAEALEYAHEKGIVHRDLKPANVKITPEGVVKVLDFGLAKAIEDPATPSDPANSPTLTAGATLMGAIMGTAAYMSPEQASGKTADRRADIWSFGAVLFEMLTGKEAFAGESISDTLATVLKVDPDWSALPKETPASIRKLVRRCLTKDRKQRLQAIGEARIALENVGQADSLPGATEVPSQAISLRHKAAVGLAALFLLTTALLSFLHFRETPPETPALRATILPPDNTTLDFTNGLGLPALSPDGKRIVFGARTTDGKNPLWVRSLEGLTAQPLAGTDGATFPFWSPDSRYIAFFADGKLKKIDASGGPALALANAPRARGGSWSQEGVIVFEPGGAAGLERVSSDGGAATPLPAAPGRLPWFLPDGSHFLYQNSGAGNGGTAQIVIGSLDGAPSKVVGEASSNALYAQGYLLYVRDGTLMTQPFDTKRLATTGEASPLAEQVQSVLNSRTAGAFSVSATGLLAYRAGADLRGGVLTWFDHSGKPGPTVGEQAVFYGAFRFSPDRKSLAAGIQNRGTRDVWTYDVSRGIPTRLTTDAANDGNPVWSPDGRSIAFDSNRKGHYDLYRRSANGSGADELLYADDLDKLPTSWSADGKYLLFHSTPRNSKTGADIWALPLTPEKPGAPLKPLRVLQTPFNEGFAQFSPDGKWIVYNSEESQRGEIYVTQFPPPLSGAGGKRQISTAGGQFPQWRQDGREIFYFGQDRRMMAAEVAVKGGAVEVGQVRALFGPITTWGGPYDVSADGQRFLIVSVPEAKSNEPLTLIQNWTAGLKK